MLFPWPAPLRNIARSKNKARRRKAERRPRSATARPKTGEGAGAQCEEGDGAQGDAAMSIATQTKLSLIHI
eukprot:10653018-Alexandrium_andersonii.AAC.1